MDGVKQGDEFHTVAIAQDMGRLDLFSADAYTQVRGPQSALRHRLSSSGAFGKQQLHRFLQVGKRVNHFDAQPSHGLVTPHGGQRPSQCRPPGG